MNRHPSGLGLNLILAAVAAATLASALSGCDSGGGTKNVGESCSEADDCAEGLNCDSGICVKADDVVKCFIDDQCDPGWACINTFCTPKNQSECTTDLECTDDKQCNAGKCEDREPEPECTKDEDCGEEQSCKEDECVDNEPSAECEKDEDCASGLCDAGAGKCIDNPTDCAENAECNDDDSCTSDVCQEGKCKNEHVVGDGCCLVDADCPPSDQPCKSVACAEFQCVETALEECCQVDLECHDDNPLTLDKCVEGKCVNEGNPCAFDADCDDGNPCTIDSCKGQQCENTATADPLCCAVDADCDDGNPETLDLCLGHSCAFQPIGICETVADCIDSNPCTKESCNAGTCVFDPDLQPDCHCVSDQDCLGKGGACGLFQIGGTTIETLCRNPVGPNLGGEVCVNHNDCKSGFCLNFDDAAICFGGCKTTLDCFGGTECGEVAFDVPDEIQTVPACMIPPDDCFGDKDCEGDQVCLPIPNPNVPNTLITSCYPKQGGPLTAGQICNTGADCNSGICLNLIEKGIHICWSACKTDIDCAAGLFCYENLIGQMFDQGTANKADDKYWQIAGCAPFLGSFQPCQADSDCPQTEYCEAYLNQTFTGLDPKCITSAGQSGAGATCSSENQCKGSWCHNTGLGSVCIGLCKSSSECFGGTTCQQVPLEIDIGNDGDNVNDLSVDVMFCLPQ